MKKKSGKPKGESAARDALPRQPEMAARCLQARYGEDAENPLMWHVVKARAHLDAAHAAAPDQPLLGALIDAAGKFNRGSEDWRERMGFHEAASQALRAGDAEFFREVARLLETKIDAPPEHRIELEVTRAFNILRAKLARLTGQVPTKKQVRETALSSIALANVMKSKGHGSSAAWAEACFCQDASGQTQWRPEIWKAVEKEIRRLPEQNWTVIFKRCGLADLPNDKGGQRSHRKGSYYR